MRKPLGILVASLLILGVAGAVRSDDQDAARAIISQAVKAAGGEANLAKQKMTTWKETGTYHGMGTPLPYTANYAMQYPDKFHMEVEGYLTMVLNGDKGWVKKEGETRAMPKEELASQQTSQKAGWIASLTLPLTGKDFTLATLGEIKIDDQPAEGVKVTAAGYPEVKLYFDKKSHLLVRSAFRLKSAEMMFKEVGMEVLYQGHKEIDGAKVPTKILVKMDGKPFVEAEFKDYKTAEKLDEKLFEKP
jgi:hypothetical protein